MVSLMTTVQAFLDIFGTHTHMYKLLCKTYSRYLHSAVCSAFPFHDGLFAGVVWMCT